MYVRALYILRLNGVGAVTTVSLFSGLGETSDEAQCRSLAIWSGWLNQVSTLINSHISAPSVLHPGASFVLVLELFSTVTIFFAIKVSQKESQACGQVDVTAS